MNIALAAYAFKNKDIAFNLRQIERGMRYAQGRADLLCFGEAFLQGFDALCWKDAADRRIALDMNSSAPIRQLCAWTKQYGLALLTGYIEKAENCLYSSCIVLADGAVLHNYRRVSKGWKDCAKTDAHYREGKSIGAFSLHGRQLSLAICGDLWEDPTRFRTQNPLIWPVYVDYSPAEWEAGALEEYASQAALAGDDVLMINPIDPQGGSVGGCVHFHKGSVASRTPYAEERVLVVEMAQQEK